MFNLYFTREHCVKKRKLNIILMQFKLNRKLLVIPAIMYGKTPQIVNVKVRKYNHYIALV
jgi:hypothetical protein